MFQFEDKTPLRVNRFGFYYWNFLLKVSRFFSPYFPIKMIREISTTNCMPIPYLIGNHREVYMILQSFTDKLLYKCTNCPNNMWWEVLGIVGSYLKKYFVMLWKYFAKKFPWLAGYCLLLSCSICQRSQLHCSPQGKIASLFLVKYIGFV